MGLRLVQHSIMMGSSLNRKVIRVMRGLIILTNRLAFDFPPCTRLPMLPYLAITLMVISRLEINHMVMLLLSQSPFALPTMDLERWRKEREKNHKKSVEMKFFYRFEFLLDFLRLIRASTNLRAWRKYQFVIVRSGWFGSFHFLIGFFYDYKNILKSPEKGSTTERRCLEGLRPIYFFSV